MRPTLVFDGDCSFCSSTARWVRRAVDPRGRFGIEPWQRLDLPALGLTEAACSEALQWVGADGAVASGHRAAAAALEHGEPVWRPLGRVLRAPGVDPLAAAVYRWVAGHRGSLPGGTPACALRE